MRLHDKTLACVGMDWSGMIVDNTEYTYHIKKRGRRGGRAEKGRGRRKREKLCFVPVFSSYSHLSCCVYHMLRCYYHLMTTSGVSLVLR